MAWANVVSNQFVSFTDAQDSPFTKHYAFSNSNQFMTVADALYYLDIVHTNLDGLDQNRWVWKGLLSSATVYQSAYYSETATRNNCGVESNPTTVSLIASTGQFTSTVSQVDANNQAINWVQANKQTYANTYGSCILRATAWRAIIPFCVQSVVLQLGDTYGGGTIVYILGVNDPGYDANVQHGIIAAPYDQGTYQWHTSMTGITGATGTAIGTGLANTQKIVTAYGSEANAARICYDLSLNGYTDWYLPSIDELVKLKTAGALTVNLYWSSTEFNYAAAKGINGAGTILNSDPKSNTYYIRAIRSF